MTIVSEDAPAVIKSYYRVVTGGVEDYDDGRELVPLLADDLDFEGPIAGHVTGAALFRQGVKGFIANVSKIDLIQEVHGPDGTAVLYDAHMPKGIVRFTEFFKFADGKIQRLRLQYDPADYIAKGGG
ncbi:nuclear transport factor 2 family protein [Nonomuraea basaltis]|uniref:nuclear transport factor 2 family protein n=1 Tax=Nonomuraea basaltis TaxID=2495887 RepID=UPI00110C4269|nr:nuclear transport factor 2 family protein [Nonomuraea basaltis]TMR91048.1 nuclear transport factor 2 family protein [Nonomuraea basaltis]